MKYMRQKKGAKKGAKQRNDERGIKQIKQTKG